MQIRNLVETWTCCAYGFSISRCLQRVYRIALSSIYGSRQRDLFDERLFIFKSHRDNARRNRYHEEAKGSSLYLFTRQRHTIKSFANELTLIARGFTSAYITVGMPRNFAFIRENALTNNRIGASKRVKLDEKVSRGNKLTTGVYAMSSLSVESE